MTNSKAQLDETEFDLLIRYNRDRKKQFGAWRQDHSGVSTSGSQSLSSARGSSGSGDGGSNQVPDSFLRKDGDFMVGAFGTSPVDVIVQDDAGVKFMDIGPETTDFSTNVILLGFGGVASNLDRIDNFAFAGQWLLIQAVLTTPITLKHQSAGGNIWIPSLSDYTITGGENVLLKYDSINGRWTVVSNFGGSGSGGDGCPPICNENDLGNVSGAVTVDWSLARFHRMVLTGDVTITFDNLPESIEEQDICIEFLEDETGGYEVSWTTTFANGNVPFIFTGPNRYTSVQLYAYEDPAGTAVVQAFNKDSVGTGIPGQPDVFAGFGGYIHAGLNFDQQSNFGLTQHIEFDKVITVDTISLSQGGGQSNGVFAGFRLGHVYSCTCYYAAKGNANTLSTQVQWFDQSADDFIGTRAFFQATTDPLNDNSQQVAVAMFTPTSVSSALEVRFRDNQNLDKVTNGSSSNEGACTVVIKDCGVTEAVIIGGPIDTGELDIREFFFGNYAGIGSTANRYNTLNSQSGWTTSTGTSDTKMVTPGIIKKVFIDAEVKGSGDREFTYMINTVDTVVFTLPANTMGLVVEQDVNIKWEAGDQLEIRTSGGAGGDEFAVTALVWYL